MSEVHRPLRIALLAYRGKPHVGGQGVYIRHLAKALTDLGHYVEVFGGQPYPVLDDRVPLTKLPSLDLYNDVYPMRKPRLWELNDAPDFLEAMSFSTGNFSEPMAFSWRAYKALKERADEFDVVHDNQTLGWGLLAIQDRLGLPVLSTIHHPITVDRVLEIEHAPNLWKQFGKRRWYSFTKMQTQVAKRMHRVMCVSENSKNDISRDHKVPIDRIHVVPVGVDPELFKPVPGVERIPGKLVTTASADVAMKGLVYLIEAVAKLRTERDVTLTVIGRPKEGQSLDKIRELGLEDAIDWVSGVPDERIVELYSEAELAVVPSLYEGFSLPAIEAMASGVCLVATTGGALPEVTGTHGETCLQVPPGDSEALANQIGEALGDAALRERIGKAGRDRVINRWSWLHTAQKTVLEYEALLDDFAAAQKAAK